MHITRDELKKIIYIFKTPIDNEYVERYKFPYDYSYKVIFSSSSKEDLLTTLPKDWELIRELFPESPTEKYKNDYMFVHIFDFGNTSSLYVSGPTECPSQQFASDNFYPERGARAIMSINIEPLRKTKYYR